MYNVMLVDDDVPVLDYLESAVPWAQLGLNLTGVFEKSRDALEAAMDAMPDFLITDIGMPEIDGLELVSRLKAKAPHLKVLIISCHNEFQYAQQALKLNVSEYVLKETLSVDTIYPILQTMIQDLENQNLILQQNERLKWFEGQHRFEIKKKLLRELLYASIWDGHDWLNRCAQQGLHLQQAAVIPVLCHVDRYAETLHKLRLTDETYGFAIDNIVTECLKDNGDGVFFPLDHKTSLLFFPVSTSIQHNPYDRIKVELHHLQKAVNRHLKSSTSFMIGEKLTIAALRTGITDMLADMQQLFYEKEGSIKENNKISYAAEDLFVHYAEAEQELKRYLLNDNMTELHTALKKWMSLIHHKKYHPSMVKEWILKLILDIQIKVKTLKHYTTSFSNEFIHHKILQMDSIFHLEEWLFDYLQQTTAPMDFQSIHNSIVVKAQNYVSNHIHEKISTETVAAYLHLNASYFSRMYKQGTGEGFIKYVMRTKMQEACKLLDTTNKTIEEISELLGYEHKSYFNKCFKSILQISPVEYRGQK